MIARFKDEFLQYQTDAIILYTQDIANSLRDEILEAIRDTLDRIKVAVNKHRLLITDENMGSSLARA